MALSDGRQESKRSESPSFCIRRAPLVVTGCVPEVRYPNSEVFHRPFASQSTPRAQARTRTDDVRIRHGSYQFVFLGLKCEGICTARKVSLLEP